MRHFDLLNALGLNIGLRIVDGAVLLTVSCPESNYLFAMSEWSKYGIHKGLFLWPILWLVTIWSVFALEASSGVDFGVYGLRPGNTSSLYGILTMPFLHGDLNHIVSNTISLFFVGVLIRYSFPSIFDRVWLFSMLLPAVGLWFIGRPNLHIGASAWLYALVAFVFFSGVLRIHLKLLAQSMLMAFLYGSFLWGVLPHDPTISYEGHLSGALVGFLLAVYFRKVEPISDLKNQEYPTAQEEVPWEDWKHPLDRTLDFQEVTSTSDTSLKPPRGPQFRYEDGSSPDELA